MDRQEQLKYCRVCKHRATNVELGMICGLTSQRATFETSCPDFIEDGAAVSKEEHRISNPEYYYSTGEPPRHKRNMLVGLFTFVIGGLIALLGFWLYWPLPFYSLPGLIMLTGIVRGILGFIQYLSFEKGRPSV